MPAIVAPSLLAANFANLEADIQMINRSEADWLHIDIMDGVFVPNISFGFPVMDAVSRIVKKPLDVHLMIVNPEKYIDRFKQSGASVLTVHLEAVTHLHSVISRIKSTGMRAGISINPHTPVSALEEVITIVDLVLIMTVNPGFGGQTFIDGSYSKIRKLRELINRSRSGALIQVDGGVNLQNAPLLLEAGVDVLVAGSTIFGSDDPPGVIRSLRNSRGMSG